MGRPAYIRPGRIPTELIGFDGPGSVLGHPDDTDACPFGSLAPIPSGPATRELPGLRAPTDVP